MQNEEIQPLHRRPSFMFGSTISYNLFPSNAQKFCGVRDVCWRWRKVRKEEMDGRPQSGQTDGGTDGRPGPAQEGTFESSVTLLRTRAASALAARPSVQAVAKQKQLACGRISTLRCVPPTHNLTLTLEQRPRDWRSLSRSRRLHAALGKIEGKEEKKKHNNNQATDAELRRRRKRRPV